MMLPELTDWWLVALALRGELVGGVVLQAPARLPDTQALAVFVKSFPNAPVGDPEIEFTGWMLDTSELEKVGAAAERALTPSETLEMAYRLRIRKVIP